MNATTDFAILPLVGAGSLRFGMTPVQVKQLLGVADKKTYNHLKQLVEFRSFMNVAFSSDEAQRLTHIGFGRQMECVRLGDIFLFKTPPLDALRALSRADPHPFLYLGFIVFLKLGLTLTGFHDQDISQKAVSFFESGAWDKRVQKMTPFHI